MNKENNYQDLQARTKAFALRVLKLADSLPTCISSSTIARQLARSGTSVAANYRAAQRARSKAEFISKLQIAHEEADESLFWLEMLVESHTISTAKLAPLMQETGEIVAILVTSLKSAKSNQP